MSRSPASMKARAAGAILAVHDGAWGRRALVLTPRNSGWRVSAATSNQSSAPLELQSLCNEHSVVRVVRVAPTRETVCRSTQIPGSGDDSQLAGTLSLLAEAELPATLPAYRRCAGVLGMSGDHERSVLLTGWLSASSPDRLTSLPETWTTPIAALAALNGESTKAAIYADPTEGALCVIAPGPARIVPRVLLELSTQPQAWSQAASSALSEASAAAGLPPADAGAPAVREVCIDDDAFAGLRGRVEGLRDDRAWIDEFGISLGAALLTGDARATRSSLATMLAGPPIVQRSRVVRIFDWLREPSNAWGVLAASLAAMLILPTLFAWARAEVLSARVAAVETASGGRDEIEQKAALYAQLENERLPISKLLMDLSRAAPIEIVAEQVRIAPRQGLTFRGRAPSNQEVNKFQAALKETRVFSEVTLGRVETKAEGVEFDLTAKISNPHVPVTKADDFVKESLAVRKYGPGATLPKPAPPEPRRSPSTARPDNTPADRRPAAVPDAPPPAVTDDEIAKMDRAALIKGWTTRKAFVQKNPALDAGVKQRLQEEEQKMRTRADALRGGGT